MLAAAVSAQSAHAQTPADAPRKLVVPAPRSESGFAVLKGRWVRPDGGYLITIRSVGPDGKLDAAYATPAPLPFSKAEVSRDGQTIRVFLALRAGGYNGSGTRSPMTP
jgi:hypothetical protein